MNDVNSANWVMSNYTFGTYENYAYDSNADLVALSDTSTVNPSIQDGVGSGPIQPNLPTGMQTYLREGFTGFGSGTTQFSDSDGHGTKWVTDTELRVTETDEWTGSLWLQSFANWDENDNLIATLDPRSSGPTDHTYETDYAYDANGNTIAVALPAASVSVNGLMQTLRPTSLYSYDSHNNLLAYCDPVKVGTSGYDWSSRPQSDSLCVEGTGATGATQYHWDTSDANELLGRLTDIYTPSGYHTAISYDASHQAGVDAIQSSPMAAETIGGV
jgi:hypothetical protein